MDNYKNHRNKKNEQEIWTSLLRWGAAAAVLFLWGLSVKWSAAGLQAKNPDDPNTQLIGYGLAIFISIAQLIFNRGAINPTLFVVGLCAYIYGIGTNFVGINQSFNFNITMAAMQSDPFGWLIDLAILGGLGFVIEVAPEAYLMWALNPKLQRPGDFISTLAFSRKEVFNPGRSNTPKPSFSVQQHPNNSVPNVQNTKPNSSNTPLEQAVRTYVNKYRSEHKGKMPSYRNIVKNTPLTSTSQVSQYLNNKS